MSRSHVFKERSFSRDFYCLNILIEYESWTHRHILIYMYMFSKTKKILVNFSYDTLLGPRYIVSYLRLE